LILPSEFQDELMLIMQTDSKLSWRLGDITALVIEYCQVNELPAGVMDCYSAIGAFCGKASRTVRDAHSIACFYPAEVRYKPEYEPLAFAHFRAAMVMGPDWEEALDWAIAQIDDLGRPASVDSMIAKFQVAPEMPETNDDSDGEGSDEDDGESEDAGNQVRAAILTIRRNIANLDLNDFTLARATEALETLEGLLIPIESR
jgi:hypothetical protein